MDACQSKIKTSHLCISIIFSPGISSSSLCMKSDFAHGRHVATSVQRLRGNREFSNDKTCFSGTTLSALTAARSFNTSLHHQWTHPWATLLLVCQSSWLILGWHRTSFSWEHLLFQVLRSHSAINAFAIADPLDKALVMLS